jgi:hypothetical protein
LESDDASRQKFTTDNFFQTKVLFFGLYAIPRSLDTLGFMEEEKKNEKKKDRKNALQRTIVAADTISGAANN